MADAIRVIVITAPTLLGHTIMAIRFTLLTMVGFIFRSAHIMALVATASDIMVGMVDMVGIIDVIRW